MINKNIFEEINSKITELNKLRPFEGYQLQQIKKFFKSETTWSSNALEGNTLTLIETEILIKDGITVNGHSVREIHECLGHADAYDFMFSLKDKKTISESDIKNLHLLFAKHIDEIPNHGEYRKEPVFITGSEYPLPHYEDVPKLMKDFVEWMEKNRNKGNAVQFAALAHKNFVYIHPFVDGNGRVARLLMNAILLQNGYLPASIPPMRKYDYSMALENGRKDKDGFVNFIGEMELMTVSDYLRMLQAPKREKLKTIKPKETDIDWDFEM